MSLLEVASPPPLWLLLTGDQFLFPLSVTTPSFSPCSQALWGQDHKADAQRKGRKPGKKDEENIFILICMWEYLVFSTSSAR